MINLEGRVLNGLDEFMLRTGHLKVMCASADENRGSWHRINGRATAILTAEVLVPPTMTDSVVEYLKKKRLVCGQNDTRNLKKTRYPDLRVDDSTEATRLFCVGEGEPRIWWQDRCFASAGVASRVGAVTVSGKSGSKTGLSHIVDWVKVAGLVSQSGELSAIGQIVLRLGNGSARDLDAWNPYLIGHDRLALAYQLLYADIDIFSRYVPKLWEANVPIRKSSGRELFAHTVEEVAREAGEARYLSAGRKNRIYECLRDLERSAKRSKKSLGTTSTAWHRAASRLETYVDIGLLEKGRSGEAERYEYVYYPTMMLQAAVDTLTRSNSAREWIEEHLVDVLYGETKTGKIDLKEMKRLLPNVTGVLARPTGPLPIDEISVALSWLLADEGKTVSFAVARRSLEDMARERPDFARLSRGGSGERAEFVSLDLERLEGQTV